MTSAAAESNDLLSLYQDVILDHGKRPRNARTVDAATCSASGNNPLCGDRVTVTARISSENQIEDVAALAKGCAISVASASLMTEVLKGQSVDAARRMFKAVQDLCTGQRQPDEAKADVGPALTAGVDRLAALSGVQQFPARVKCATLPWHVLISCIEGTDRATTETGSNA
ncbi:MAG: SUF system NifU family Fe-S cluster assembly protein [Rhodobacteraceae bacterium]|nr:SUF system NifU family Fe-S cluster assembly protein [Paracoccaceae bacterium]